MFYKFFLIYIFIISCIGNNSDVFVFFEGNEIEELEGKVIEGIHVNLENPESLGKITAELKEISMQKIDTKIVKSEEGSVELMELYIHPRAAYPRFVERGNLGFIKDIVMFIF